MQIIKTSHIKSKFGPGIKAAKMVLINSGFDQIETIIDEGWPSEGTESPDAERAVLQVSLPSHHFPPKLEKAIEHVVSATGFVALISQVGNLLQIDIELKEVTNKNLDPSKLSNKINNFYEIVKVANEFATSVKGAKPKRLIPLNSWREYTHTPVPVTFKDAFVILGLNRALSQNNWEQHLEEKWEEVQPLIIERLDYWTSKYNDMVSQFNSNLRKMRKLDRALTEEFSKLVQLGRGVRLPPDENGVEPDYNDQLSKCSSIIDEIERYYKDKKQVESIGNVLFSSVHKLKELMY